MQKQISPVILTCLVNLAFSVFFIHFHTHCLSFPYELCSSLTELIQPQQQWQFSSETFQTLYVVEL